LADIRKRTLKSGEAVYTVRVRVLGKPTQTKTFRKLGEAKQWAAMAETETRQAVVDVVLNQAAPYLLADAIADFWKLKKYKGKNHADQTRQAQVFWLNYLKNPILNDITPRHIADGRDALLQMGYAPATVVKFKNAISVVFSHAQEAERVAMNPVKLVKNPKVNNQRLRALSEMEQTALLEACKQSESQHLFAVVTLALTTGGRKSELLGLKWKNVDFRQKMLVFEDTKNSETRAVPMIGQAYTLLKAMAPGKPKDLVFPNDAGQIYHIRRAYETAVKRAGLENFRFHDLRHTAASNLAMSGATLYELQVYFGWKTPAMANRYAHLTRQHLQGLAERMAERCGLMHAPPALVPDGVQKTGLKRVK
jgi:integrase